MEIEETIDGVRVGMKKAFLVEEIFHWHTYCDDPANLEYDVECWALEDSYPGPVHCFVADRYGWCPVKEGELVVGKCVAVGPDASFSLWEKIDEKEEESDGLA